MDQATHEFSCRFLPGSVGIRENPFLVEQGFFWIIYLVPIISNYGAIHGSGSKIVTIRGMMLSLTDCGHRLNFQIN